MQEIMIKAADGKLYRNEGGRELKRLDRINAQLQEAKRMHNVIIYLKTGRKLREIKRNLLLKQKPLFK